MSSDNPSILLLMLSRVPLSLEKTWSAITQYCLQPSNDESKTQPTLNYKRRPIFHTHGRAMGVERKCQLDLILFYWFHKFVSYCQSSWDLYNQHGWRRDEESQPLLAFYHSFIYFYKAWNTSQCQQLVEIIILTKQTNKQKKPEK